MGKLGVGEAGRGKVMEFDRFDQGSNPLTRCYYKRGVGWDCIGPKKKGGLGIGLGLVLFWVLGNNI